MIMKKSTPVNFLMMKTEVELAVDFILDLMKKSKPVTVEPVKFTISDTEWVQIRNELCRVLYNQYSGHWFPGNPMRGSGYRCIRINGMMDPLVEAAGALLGLSKVQLRMLFPSELTVWVDPDEVCYRIGEQGSICTLYSNVKRNHQQKKIQQKPKTPVKYSPPSSPVHSPPHHHKSFHSSPPSSPISFADQLNASLYGDCIQIQEILQKIMNNSCKSETFSRFPSSSFDSIRNFGGGRNLTAFVSS